MPIFDRTDKLQWSNTVSPLGPLQPDSLVSESSPTMPDPTPADASALIAAARARTAAADSEDSWARGRTNLTWTPEQGDGTAENYRTAAVWYDDGDQCAEVHSNLGRGFYANAWAEFFAHARADVPALCDLADAQQRRVAELESERDHLREALIKLAGLPHDHIEDETQYWVCPKCVAEYALAASAPKGDESND